MASTYAVLNGLIEGVGACISSISGGIISDRFESKNKMTKAYLGMISSFIGIFTAFGISLFTGTNFYFSLFFLCLKFLFTECWMAPTITMMQSTVVPQMQGSIVSAYLFFLTFAGTLSAISIGSIANFFGATTNPWIYGKVIFGGSIAGYLLSIPCFWKAGKSYIKFQQEQLEKNKKALE